MKRLLNQLGVVSQCLRYSPEVIGVLTVEHLKNVFFQRLSLSHGQKSMLSFLCLIFPNLELAQLSEVNGLASA
jgi:hypothetical protein